jgi:asparagine N-glycosylation enzyme membrane subunit Stt3
MGNFPAGRRREVLLLSAILLAALALRLTTFPSPHLLGVDPYHHYRIAERVAETGSVPETWYLSNYPEGGVILEPDGLYQVSALLFRLLSPLGISFLEAFKLASPLFGVFVLLPFYLLAVRIFPRKAALYSLAVLALFPAFLYRTFSGFYRGDTFFS